MKQHGCRKRGLDVFGLCMKLMVIYFMLQRKPCGTYRWNRQKTADEQVAEELRTTSVLPLRLNPLKPSLQESQPLNPPHAQQRVEPLPGLAPGLDAGTSAGTDAGISAGPSAGTSAWTSAGTGAGSGAGTSAGPRAGTSAPDECRKALSTVSEIRIYLEIAINSQTEYKFMNEKDMQILSVLKDFNVSKVLTYKIITLIAPGVCEEVEICNGPLVCSTEYCVVKQPKRVTCPAIHPSCPLVR
ncbi:unnamed protein product [Dicrocoelium dendriticum]|nr:unnamed protein product [Dicrocoelium dendriticum]